MGSDLDIVAIVDDSPLSFESRAAKWELNDLPVPAELLVYTRKEWISLQQEANYFIRRLNQEVIWTFRRPASSEASTI